jgi:hypothetical protein
MVGKGSARQGSVYQSGGIANRQGQVRLGVAGRGKARQGRAWQGLFHIQQETLKHEFSDRHDEGKAR